MNARYERQMVLPEVGSSGQAKLANARVLVVGLGGLGSAVVQYLSGAGCGHLLLIEHDRVAENNLHRQPLYRMSDVGELKAVAARRALLALNPHVQIDAIVTALTPANADALTHAVDIVIDAADSFAVTYVLSDACQRSQRPLVSASVLGQRGYVGVFCGRGPSYRALFPELPQRAGTCAEHGVLGTSVGVLGTLQAHLALALLLDTQPSMLGQCITVDLRALRFERVDFSRAAEPHAPLRFIARCDLRDDDVLVDLRSASERAAWPGPPAHREFPDVLSDAARLSSRIVLCCASGVRAWHAARQLQHNGAQHLALLALASA